MGTWLNDDGLNIRYGVDEATVVKGGEYSVTGELHVIEIEFTGTDLGSSAAILEEVIVPSGARIEAIEVIAQTAFTSGGSATLDIGLVRQDRTTAYDDDGFVAALALTSIDADGDRVELVQGSTGHGALVGTTLANAGYPVFSYNTAAYTAGKGLVRIKFYVPRPA